MTMTPFFSHSPNFRHTGCFQYLTVISNCGAFPGTDTLMHIPDYFSNVEIQKQIFQVNRDDYYKTLCHMLRNFYFINPSLTLRIIIFKNLCQVKCHGNSF